MDRVVIFDTTLRDGEQSPGASLNTKQKLEIGLQLAKLNVDIIEAGFPVSSPGDFEGVKMIAQTVKGPTICGLARATKKDIETCWEAIKYAKNARIHTFIATSVIHMKYKLKMSEQEVLHNAVEAVKYAKRFTSDVEFSPEDAARSDFEFLCRVIDAVINAGAKTVNIPDTVGYAIPGEFGDMIKRLIENVKSSSKAVFSVHCHNDLGLATANSLAAVVNGVRQVECTVNGIGERAGNASLEEVVMAIKTRSRKFKLFTGIKTEQIIKTSKLVSSLTGIPVQPNKAIVGSNAFAHEAGIHQHGVLSKSLTYEIMTPQSVGLKESKLVLGKHSGRHAFKQKLKELGYNLSQKEFQNIFEEFKNLADKKKEVFDEDIEAIIEEKTSGIPEMYQLKYVNVTTGNQTIPTATVQLARGKDIIQEASCGDGPIDAAYQAIDKITGISCSLSDYTIRSVSSGKDALGEVMVRIKHKHLTVTGRGASTDIIEASVKAYVNAINRLVYKGLKKQNTRLK